MVILVIVIIIFLRDIFWLGNSGLIPIFVGLIIAIGLLAGYLLKKN